MYTIGEAYMLLTMLTFCFVFFLLFFCFTWIREHFFSWKYHAKFKFHPLLSIKITTVSGKSFFQTLFRTSAGSFTSSCCIRKRHVASKQLFTKTGGCIKCPWNWLPKTIQLFYVLLSQVDRLVVNLAILSRNYFLESFSEFSISPGINRWINAGAERCCYG